MTRASSTARQRYVNTISCVLKEDSETMNDATYNVLVKIAQALEEIAEHLEVIRNELNGDSNG